MLVLRFGPSVRRDYVKRLRPSTGFSKSPLLFPHYPSLAPLPGWPDPSGLCGRGHGVTAVQPTKFLWVVLVVMALPVSVNSCLTLPGCACRGPGVKFGSS
jgi:hypothetical protein